MSVIKYWLALAVVLVWASLAVAQEEFNTQMMRATVKISHDRSTGTGFILQHGKTGQFVLVTAAHVLNNTPGDETTVIFRKVEGDEWKKEPTRLQIRKDGQPAWTQHPKEDVAVIAITPPENVDLPVLSTELLATDETLQRLQVHPGMRLMMLGYPHREESSPAGFPVLRDGAIASYPLLPTEKTRTFTLSANIFEGNSGGPVYLALPQGPEGKSEPGTILGVVSAQRFLDEEMKMIYGTSKIRHRFGLGIIVHAAFVLETLEKMK
jgi:S1-C subfamily serine protease